MSVQPSEPASSVPDHPGRLPTDLFDYDLPLELIAQQPAEPRDASRLLVLDRATGQIEHAHFREIGRWLAPGDLLVVLGLVIVVIGAGIMLFGRLPFLGNLPGPLSFEVGGVRVYIPIVASILISIVLTVVLNVAFGLFNRR